MNNCRLYGECVIMSLRAEDVYQQLFWSYLRVILYFGIKLIQCHCAHHILTFFYFFKKLFCLFLLFLYFFGFSNFLIFCIFLFFFLFSCFFNLFIFCSLFLYFFLCFSLFISILLFFSIKTHFPTIKTSRPRKTLLTF